MHISKDQRLDAISGRDQMAEKPPTEEASRRFRTPACYSILGYLASGNQKDLSDELARIDSLAEKLGKEKESCIETYISIEKQMKEVKNEDENDVLFYRYVKGLRFWEIAEKMDCSEQWVHKLHGRALAHLKLPT